METKSLLSYLSYYRLLLIALLLLFITTVVVQLNYNKNHMKDFTVDEYYTITTVHPDYDPSNTVHRALNGPRLFTYLFYPGALVGMIGHMGGNIYVEGWDYPGHNYIVENYKLPSSQAAQNLEDPNLRYFRYYLKFQAIILFFLTMIPLLFYLWKRKNFVAMFMFSTLVGINFLALEERSLFYIEPLLLSMMNLLLWLYLYLFDKKKLNVFWILLSALVIGISLSLKFSSLFFIVLLAVLIVFKAKDLEKRIQNLLLLSLFSVLVFCLVNWNMFYSKEVFNNMVHDYFSNFWQYATGARKEVVQNFRVDNLKGIMSELFTSFGGILFLLPVIVVYGFIKLNNKEKIKWGGVLLVLLISISLIVGQRVYMDRNILPFLPALVLVSGIMIDEIIRHLDSTGQINSRNAKRSTHIILIAILILPIIIFKNDYFKTLIPRAKTNIESNITRIQDKENRRLLGIDYNIGATGSLFASAENLASFPETYGYKLKDEATKYSKNLLTSDIVVLREVKNNKQLATYILPNLFNSNEQFGNYFLYYNDLNKDKTFMNLKSELEKPNSPNLILQPMSIREDLVLEEVRLKRSAQGYRVYLKLQLGDLLYGNLEGCRFYIHTRPFESDLNDLPKERISHGFEGWGFSVSEKNLVKFGKTAYVFGDFNPVLSYYKSLSLGIFKGCAESDDVFIDNVQLP